jgi:integral membrane protein
MKNIVSILRFLTIAEAISYLLLLVVAMPLKYVWHLPIAVQITGPIHGILFLAFAYALCQAYLLAQWPLSRAILLFLASFIPIVPFFLDGRLRSWAEDYARKHGL